MVLLCGADGLEAGPSGDPEKWAPRQMEFVARGGERPAGRGLDAGFRFDRVACVILLVERRPSHVPAAAGTVEDWHLQ